MTVVKFLGEKKDIVIEVDAIAEISKYKVIELIKVAAYLELPVRLMFDKPDKEGMIVTRYMHGFVEIDNKSMTSKVDKALVTILEVVGDWETIDIERPSFIDPLVDNLQYRTIRIDRLVAITFSNMHYKVI